MLHLTASTFSPILSRAIALLAVTVLSSSVSDAQLIKAQARTTKQDVSPALERRFQRLDMVGRSLPEYPGFTFSESFFEGTPVEFAIDPADHVRLDPGVYDVYVILRTTGEDFDLGAQLIDVRGMPQSVVLSNGTLAGNAVTLDTGALSGDAGIGFGVGYDVVLDVDGNGQLSHGDFIDGRREIAGFYVVRDPASVGPLAVTETSYFVTGVKSGFEGENSFYPTNIASMGKLPLVVISHGNGHNYNWYDHIGKHLASYGFVVMSHENDTVPGIETASTTTIDHTDAFLGSLATIEGGVFDGHIDTNTIIWIGHSRGAEGIVRAYDKIVDEEVFPANYDANDIVGLSSIAPTVFLNASKSDPHDVPVSLWTGAADADVNGCASTPITFTFLIHERAIGDRYSIHMHGAGHGAYHNGGGSLVASGPCRLTRAETHAIMRSYLLPLVYQYAFASPAAPEFLWRQYEDFSSPNLTLSSCVVVNKTYQVRSSTRFVVDDFQDATDFFMSSSGGAVSKNVGGVGEHSLNDPNTTFTFVASQPSNGMTMSINGAARRGTTFGWTADNKFMEWEVVAGQRNFSLWDTLTFRACQVTRHTNTIAELGSITFDVTLRDESGLTSTINIGAYGGGVEEPYQRTGCGTGTGWANFFESIRIPIQDFVSEQSGVDLKRIEAIRFDFGASHGSAVGRLALDDLELIVD
ncbi:MAG: hypothetical protein ACI8TQ_001138 [Planctomycetota bacterium]|jgi:hypothetical protein